MNPLEGLLGPKSDAELQSLVQMAQRITQQRFGRVVQLYAPLYISNECIDICRYCGFSLENEIVRRTLTMEEVSREADFLIGQGFRHLLLVAGEHPAHVSPDYVTEIARRIRPKLASLAIETAPFREPDYQQLRENGVDGVLIYQETYDPAQYLELHLAGPKKSYERRRRALEEAGRARIPRLGMGILLGLADWRDEALALADHLRELRREFWQSEFTISLPRIRPCAGAYEPPLPVSDRDFIQLIAALRITFPEVGIVLSTREKQPLRDFLIGVGVTQMSAGSRTNPGGYLEGTETTTQFEIEDHRTPAEVAQAIRAKGYDPVWRDWITV